MSETKSGLISKNSPLKSILKYVFCLDVLQTTVGPYVISIYLSVLKNYAAW